MVRAVRQQQPDAVFHLGDCERDTQRLEKEFPDLPLYRVCGNCDREPVNPEVLQCTLDGVKFFCTHGDRYGVKYTLDALLNAAYFAGADIVLFGHTHRALSETMQGLYVVNPGTAGVHLRPHRDTRRRDPQRRHPCHSGSINHAPPACRRGRMRFLMSTFRETSHRAYGCCRRS